MNRFFVDPEAISEKSVNIPDEVASQIRKVLRLKEGTAVQFLDNRGWVYESEIHYIDTKNITAEIKEKRPAEGEPSCAVSLYIGLTHSGSPTPLRVRLPKIQILRKIKRRYSPSWK